MEAAALEKEPHMIKISSKRQITIPARWYKEMDFQEYALCSWTDKGLLIQPVDCEDEDITVDILRHLIDKGYEGEELIQQYQKVKPTVISYTEKLAEAKKAIEENRTVPFDEMITELKERYDL